MLPEDRKQTGAGQICFASRHHIHGAAAPQHLPVPNALLRPDLLQFLRAVHKLIRIRLRNDPPLVRLLHKELVSLLLRKRNRRIFRVKVQMCALHEIRRTLPAHQRVLPSVAF